jgi:hypothetical protein
MTPTGHVGSIFVAIELIADLSRDARQAHRAVLHVQAAAKMRHRTIMVVGDPDMPTTLPAGYISGGRHNRLNKSLSPGRPEFAAQDLPDDVRRHQ